MLSPDSTNMLFINGITDTVCVVSQTSGQTNGVEVLKIASDSASRSSAVSAETSPPTASYSGRSQP